MSLRGDTALDGGSTAPSPVTLHFLIPVLTRVYPMLPGEIGDGSGRAGEKHGLAPVSC